MNKKGCVWDILFWAGIIVVLIWASLKSFGIIHSPVWVDMIPYFSIAVSAIGGAYKVGKIMKGIETTESKVTKLLEIEERFEGVEKMHKLCLDGKLKDSPYKKK